MNHQYIRSYRKKKSNKKKIFLTIFLSLAFLGLSLFFLFFFKTTLVFNQMIERGSAENPDNDFVSEIVLPAKDADRINILLIGLRGEGGDPEDGLYLSDSMSVLTIKKSTGQTALISIPRDLYVEIYSLQEKHKLNFAYAQCGMDCAKKTVSYVTGLWIDHGLVLNFKAFEEIVETVGGVSLYLNEPFSEKLQWTKEGWPDSPYWYIEKDEQTEKEYWVFEVPQGRNRLNATTTLYYVRSRFSSSDFDRMRRQQQVIFAVKNQLISLGVLANPVKLFNLLDIAGRNIKTDMSLTQIKSFINLMNDLDVSNVRTLILDSAPDGFLYETFYNKEYILLPVGDNFDNIQKACLDIFN